MLHRLQLTRGIGSKQQRLKAGGFCRILETALGAAGQSFQSHGPDKTAESEK